MKISKFDIKNFKGIEHTVVHLTDDCPGNISTLIGLNESGKTTILEALSHFVTEDKDTASLVGTVSKRSDLQDLIPKDRKAAFTGDIAISAATEFEDRDITDLASFMLEKHDLIIDQTALPQSFSVQRCYRFMESKLTTSRAFWTLSLYVKTRKAKKFRRISGLPEEAESEKELWRSAINFLQDRMPKIVYFPTFLFDFPDRIYLSDDNSDINLYYKQVIQDVLDRQGDGLNVQRHIIDRINSVKNEHSVVSTFFAFFFQRDEKKQIDAVLQKASNEMSNVIFGAWNQILGRNVTGKRVQIDWLLDVSKNNAPYLEVFIVDGQSKYSLSERSLGFRWFFSFLLFTEFRRNRNSDSSTIFLFDEPAANLHSKAQMKLLESFSRIGSGKTFIIYSTHSHYMVNPF